MRAILLLVLAMGATTASSAQAGAPITHGPGSRQAVGSSSPGGSQPLAVSSPRAEVSPAPVIPGNVTCPAGVDCPTVIGFTILPSKPEHPAIILRKTADVSSFAGVGSVITYTFTVTNNGTVPVHGVTVVDNKIGAVSCPATTVAKGTSMSCIARYTVTAADVAARLVANTGTVTAFTPNNVRVTSSASLVVPMRTVAVPVTG